MELVKEIAISFAVYMTALIISGATMGALGDNVITAPQFNWVGIIFVGVAFTVLGMHKGRNLKE